MSVGRIAFEYFLMLLTSYVELDTSLDAWTLPEYVANAESVR